MKKIVHVFEDPQYYVLCGGPSHTEVYTMNSVGRCVFILVLCFLLRRNITGFGSVKYSLDGGYEISDDKSKG